MALTTKTCDFTDESMWVFDDNLVEFIDDKPQFKIGDATPAIFTEPFTSPTGHTYDASRAVFTAGGVEQLNKTPTDSIIAATYTLTKNLSWSNIGSSLTATDYGTPTLVEGKLQCHGSHGVTYSIANNMGTGSFKFKYTPDYTAGPSQNVNLFNIKNSANNNSRVTLTNSPSGNNFRLFVRDESGATIFSTVVLGYTASLVEGVEVEVLFTWDSVSGICRTFLEGNLLGTSAAIPWTHGTGTAQVDVGAAALVYRVAEGSFRDCTLFDTIQETATYTSGYSLNETRYLGSKVDIPTFTYTGPGEVQSFSGFTTTESNAPRYIINNRYYNSGWVDSDDTWGESSLVGSILANISTLPASDIINISALFNDSNEMMRVENLTLTYTGQFYPLIAVIDRDPNYRCWVTEATTFVANGEVTPSSTSVGYIQSRDGSLFYESGATWVASNGTTQNNTAVEVNAAIGTLFDGSTRYLWGPRIILTGDGLGTPTLESIETTADFALPNPTMDFVDVNGWFQLSSRAAFNGKKIYIRPYLGAFPIEGLTGATGVITPYTWEERTTITSEGFASFGLIRNPSGKYWEIKWDDDPNSYYFDMGIGGSTLDLSTVTLMLAED